MSDPLYDLIWCISSSFELLFEKTWLTGELPKWLVWQEGGKLRKFWVHLSQGGGGGHPDPPKIRGKVSEQSQPQLDKSEKVYIFSSLLLPLCRSLMKLWRDNDSVLGIKHCYPGHFNHPSTTSFFSHQLLPGNRWGGPQIFCMCVWYFWWGVQIRLCV